MSQELIFDPKLQSLRNLAWWLYLFHGASLLFTLGAVSWIPLIVDYVKRDDAAGTFVHSHFQWQIRSFWWYLFWVIVGGVLFMSIIGIPVAYLAWTLAWLWKAYRLIKGLLDLDANKPMPV